VKPKVPEIHAPAQGGQVLEAPKIEVIREKSPDRKSSLAPGVYCSVINTFYENFLLFLSPF
jgi:hypothetical protein